MAHAFGKLAEVIHNATCRMHCKSWRQVTMLCEEMDTVHEVRVVIDDALVGAGYSQRRSLNFDLVPSVFLFDGFKPKNKTSPV